MAERRPAEPAAGDFLSRAEMPVRKPRKACRRETVHTLKRLTMPPRTREPIVDSEEVARLWIANRCFACSRCPRLVARLAKWYSGSEG